MELLEDPRAEVVDEIAAKLGLRKVLRLRPVFCRDGQCPGLRGLGLCPLALAYV